MLMNMKKFFAIAAIMFLSVIVYAQRVDVVEVNEIFGKETHPALATQVMFTDAKTVMKEFTSFIKNYKPESLSSKKGMLFADNVVIPEISENAIDVYANIKQKKGSDVVDLVVAFCIGGNMHVTSSQAPTQYPAAYNMLKTFANDLTNKNHNAMLKTAEKALSKEEKKMASYEKKDAKLQKSIESYKKDIAKLEKKMSKAESQKEEVNKKMDDQRVVVREKKDVYKKIENL